MTARGPLHGVVAAALTPLRAGGDEIDSAGVAALADFYLDAGVVGVLICGTTGESLLLGIDERKRLLEEFLAAAAGRFAVAVQAGAQSTASTVSLCAHAAEVGASAVAVAPPPFFALDEAALIAHLQAAAAACAPLPFYLNEIRQRIGYAIPLSVVHALRASAPNMVGMKVSDPSIEEVEHYLLPGLDVMVGAEALAREGLARGAVGVLSGLAGALPRHVAAAIFGQPGHGAPLGSLRAGLERFPFHAAAKLAVIAQHVAIEPCVRAPLRQLAPAERTELEDWLASGVLTSPTTPAHTGTGAA